MKIIIGPLKLFIFMLVATACCAQLSIAQTADSKPIRIIVPYTAGGATDAIARAVAARVSESMGRPVLIDNRPGASSIIGMQACAKAEPDGSTLCIAVPDSLSYNPQLFTNLPYDAEKDFAPVIALGFSNSLLVANAGAPFNSYKEMIAYARAHPGVLNWAPWGAATIPDVYLRWLVHQTGVNIVSIPYKGASGSIPAVLSGEANITYMGFGTAFPHIKAGKIKALATIGNLTIGNKRSAYMPDLPTLGEEEGGDPGLFSYFGIFAPAATPKAVLERLNSEFAKAIRTPQVKEYFKVSTIDAYPNSVDQFTAIVKNDRETAAKVFQSIGIRPTAAP